MCWACPPYDLDDEEYAAGYEYITLVATKIAAVRTGIAVSANESRDADSEMLRRQRLRLDGRLLELERTCNGRAFFAGTCNLCPPAECTRGAKLPCRHPDLIRPSLEACGFDVGVTVEKLFGMELKWGTKESAPEYYILVSALAHDTLFRMEF